MEGEVVIGGCQNSPETISLKKSTIQKKSPPNLESNYAIPFGIPEIDSKLPNKGLQQGTIHEFFYNDSLQPEAVAGGMSDTPLKF
jgi:hypothetical protein